MNYFTKPIQNIIYKYSIYFKKSFYDQLKKKMHYNTNFNKSIAYGTNARLSGAIILLKMFN